MSEVASRAGSPPGWYPDPVAPLARRQWRGRLRQVAWASVPVWSFGFLAWVPFAARAARRRSAKAWALCAAYAAAGATEFVLAGVGPPAGAAANWAGGIAFTLMGAGAIHACVSFRPAADLHAAAAALPPPPTNQRALASAQARVRCREEARKLAQARPVLARELRIGRPDLPRQYDDGGLVDVNHVPAGVLTSLLGLTPEEAGAVTAARDRLGRFTSAEELSVYADLPPDRMDSVRDLLWFG